MEAFNKLLPGLFVIFSLFLYTLIIYKMPTLFERMEYKANELEDVKNKTWTILMTVNDGYFDFFQNWMHYYNKLQLKYPLIVIAEDDNVFLRLNQLNGNNRFIVVRSGRISLDHAVVYGTKDFSKLASGRPTYILRYLENGTNILYADTDSVWLKDPFPFFNGSFDMWAQMDGSSICSGFLAIRNNERAIRLVKMWEKSLKRRLDIDQRVLNNVYRNATIHLQLLDTSLFPSGELYFKKFSDIKRKHVVVVHNNYIKGHDKKLERFKKFKLWFAK